MPRHSTLIASFIKFSIFQEKNLHPICIAQRGCPRTNTRLPGSHTHATHYALNTTPHTRDSIPSAISTALLFTKQIQQSNHLWSAINKFDFVNTPIDNLHQLITLTFVLKEHINLEVQNTIALKFNTVNNKKEKYVNIIDDTIQFDSQPELSKSTIKKAFPSFTSQLFSPSRNPSSNPMNKNYVSLLQDFCCFDSDSMGSLDHDMNRMNTDPQEHSNNSPPSKKVTWRHDTGISSFSETYSLTSRNINRKQQRMAKTNLTCQTIKIPMTTLLPQPN